MTHPVARSCPRALPVTPRTGRQCRGALWSCRGALLVMSFLAMRACVLLCHDTIYYIVTQTEKWVVAHLVSLVQKYIYIFTSSSRTKNIYYNFFFLFYTLYNLRREKNFSSTLFFFLCAIHQAYKHTSIIKMYNGCMI